MLLTQYINTLYQLYLLVIYPQQPFLYILYPNFSLKYITYIIKRIVYIVLGLNDIPPRKCKEFVDINAIKYKNISYIFLINHYKNKKYGL